MVNDLRRLTPTESVLRVLVHKMGLLEDTHRSCNEDADGAIQEQILDESAIV